MTHVAPSAFGAAFLVSPDWRQPIAFLLPCTFPALHGGERDQEEEARVDRDEFGGGHERDGRSPAVVVNMWCAHTVQLRGVTPRKPATAQP